LFFFGGVVKKQKQQNFYKSLEQTNRFKKEREKRTIFSKGQIQEYSHSKVANKDT